MKLLRFIFKFIFSICCIVGTVGFAVAGFNIYKNQPTSNLIEIGIGAGIFTLIWLIFLSRRDSFWSVVEHELTHAVFALLFFKKVRTLNADRRRGGLVRVEGGNFIIALAPYFFPFLSAIIIIIKPIIFSNYQWFLNALLGFTLTFHLLYLLNEFHPSQPDLRENGFIFSLIVVIFFNLFFIGLSLASLPGQWANMASFIKMGLKESWQFMLYGWEIITFKLIG
jgi:hypothetical protein